MSDPDLLLVLDAAVSHARRRGGRLLSVTLSGEDASMKSLARDALRTLGYADVEVRVEARGGPMRLLAIEVASEPRSK